jgi:hypothetical protein
MELIDININLSENSKGEFPQKKAALEEVKKYFGENNVSNYPGAYLIPQLGHLKWDGHIYVSGATGAGKSYLIRQIVEHDLSTRKVYLFSHVNNDPSLKGLVLNKYDGDRESLKDSICIFDDYPGTDLRDDLLEKGRHDNSMVVCVNHKHREWRTTMKPLNESKYVVLFPSANKGTVVKEMGLLGMDRNQRNAIINLSQQEGRYLILHQHAPNAIITQESVVKL